MRGRTKQGLEIPLENKKEERIPKCHESAILLLAVGGSRDVLFSFLADLAKVADCSDYVVDCLILLYIYVTTLQSYITMFE